MSKAYHTIIVGSGLAGMAAADILTRYGLSILVIDDNPHTGGQLLRKPSHTGSAVKRFEPDRLKRRGMLLAERLKTSKAHLFNCAQVLGIFPERSVLLETRYHRTIEYRADALILATGARERQLPFKGWTLPGVMATGAAQILMKSSGILPGRNALIGGCGPLIFAVAAEILANSGGVQAVLDQCTTIRKLKAVTAALPPWSKLIEGAVYLAQLALARVPLKTGVRIVEAQGRQDLETVIAGRVDEHGHVIQGTEKIFRTDTLAVGYGFSPNIELPQQAGCAISYGDEKGGWYVDVSETMATSVTGIYAVGETTGIAGATKSVLEGQIAAWDILYIQGRIDRHTYKKHTRPLMHKRRQQVQFGHLLNLLCRMEPEWYEDIPDETIVCRCEEITLGEIRRQMNNGFYTMQSVKKATRSGMGICQGRICGPIIFDVIGAFSQQQPAEIGFTSARAPVKTVLLKALAQMSKNGGFPIRN